MISFLKKLLTILIMASSLYASGQDSNKIAGFYVLPESGALLIRPDNTFMIVGYGTMIKGKVEIIDSIAKLIPDQPTHPFVLYGRTNRSIVSGNKIMFNGLDDEETLINCSANNSALKSMKPVFNSDANCVDYPVVLNNKNDNQKFYFAKQRENNVYEFENNQGYNDFIVMYIKEKKKPEFICED